jgi:arylsulfatase A-like enzyme
VTDREENPLSAHGRSALGWTLALATATALVTGLVQAAVLAWRSEVRGQLIWHSRDHPWMGPAAYLLLFLPLAIALYGGVALASRLGWKGDARRWIAAVFVFLAAVALLLMWPRIHALPMALLAVGLSVQGGRLLARRSTRALGRFAVGLTLFTVVLGLGGRVWRTLAERRTLSATPPAAGDAPNVLFIILDTVRAASLSLYGYERATTPALARWAADGVVFDRAISSASWTLPSHSTMFTGRNAADLTANWRTPLDRQNPTIAERFRDHGYATAGFVANTYYAGHDSGLERGFGRYEDYRTTLKQVSWSSTLAQTNLARSLRWNVSPRGWWSALQRFDLTIEPLLISDRKTGAMVSDDFLAWQASLSGRPFFAFLNYFDAHEKYDPPMPYRRLFSPTPVKKDLYEGSIRYLDDQLDRLFTTLRARGVLDRTIVVVTSDHGEQFGEHKLWGHGNSLYLPVLHVPLMVRYPGRVPTNQRVERPVSLRDLPATLLDLARLDASRMPGRTLARYWSPTDGMQLAKDVAESYYTSSEDGWLPSARQRGMRSLVAGDLHWIRKFDGTEELYNYRSDRAELRNLANDASSRALVDSLRPLLGAMGESRND